MPVIPLGSLDDARLAAYRGVTDPALAREHGLFVAEGRRVVERLLAHPSLVTRSVLVTPTARQALEPALARTPAVPVFEVPQGLLNAVAGFNIHRGCLALAERPTPPDWTALTAGARRLIVLERVGDADNVGSVFRSAAAFGVDAVLLGPSCADPLYRKAIRTSMAASLSVPFAIATPWPGVLSALADRGWSVLGLTPRHDQPPLWEAASPRHQATALVLGHEGDGLTPAALEACTGLARIPMALGIDSLNISVSAAVALYELARRPVAETES